MDKKNQNIVRWISIWILACLVSTPLAVYGGFFDSLVYYNQAQYLWEHGLVDGVRTIVAQTGKVEVGFLTLLWAQKGLKGLYGDDALFPFLMVNGFIVSMFMVASYERVLRGEGKLKEIVFGSAVILFSYYTYSNSLYVWRSIIALYFLILFAHHPKVLMKMVYLGFGFLFHHSVVVFAAIYVMSGYVYAVGRKSRLQMMLVLSAVAVIFVFVAYLAVYKSNLLGFAISGGEVGEVYSVGASVGDIVKRLVIVLPLVLALIYAGPRGGEVMQKLWIFSLLLLGLSIVLSSSWQISWRVAMPGMLVGTIVLASRSGFTVGKMLLMLSSIPVIRLMYLMLTGAFNPVSAI